MTPPVDLKRWLGRFYNMEIKAEGKEDKLREKEAESDREQNDCS